MQRCYGVPRWALGAAALAALAACAAPAPPLGRPVAETAASGAEPGGAYVRAREEQRRGIGIPPALPPAGAVDRLPGSLRALRPAPGTGPASPPPPAQGSALSRLSALPASPLANPPGGLALGRPR